jgi:two-component system, NarL family, nitrate/nitrite response regulator NarL
MHVADRDAQSPRSQGVLTRRDRPSAHPRAEEGRAVRAYVVSDVRVTRQALADCLQRRGVNVIGHTACTADVPQTLQRDGPDVALVDMAGGGTTVLIRRISRTARVVRPIAFGLQEDAAGVIACAEAGVAAFISSDGSLADLVAAIESVVRGEATCSPRMTAELLRRLALLADGGRVLELEPVLTTRELQVAALISDGMTNKEIARRLSIEVATVKNHVHHILEKLGVRRRREILARLREGSLRPQS